MAYLLDFIKLTSYGKQTGEAHGKPQNNKPMKKLKPFHSTLTAVTASVLITLITTPASQAAIVWGSFTETPTTLNGSASWDGAPAPEVAYTTSSPNGYWGIEAVFNKTLKTAYVQITGQHLVAPHPVDTAPSDTVELGLWLPRPTGTGMSTGMTEHNIAVAHHPNGHTDTWKLDAQATPNGANIEFAAVHVPESPKTGIVFGGLTIGFLAVRRIRRRND